MRGHLTRDQLTRENRPSRSAALVVARRGAPCRLAAASETQVHAWIRRSVGSPDTSMAVDRHDATAVPVQRDTRPSCHATAPALCSLRLPARPARRGAPRCWSPATWRNRQRRRVHHLHPWQAAVSLPLSRSMLSDGPPTPRSRREPAAPSRPREQSATGRAARWGLLVSQRSAGLHLRSAVHPRAGAAAPRPRAAG